MVVVGVVAVVVEGPTTRCRSCTPVQHAFIDLCVRVGHMFGAMLGVFWTIYVGIRIRCDFFRLGTPHMAKIDSDPIQAHETL